MRYRVQFHMETPEGLVVRESELPALPSGGSKVILGPGLVGFVQPITLCIDGNDEALYLIPLTPLDTPPPTS